MSSVEHDLSPVRDGMNGMLNAKRGQDHPLTTQLRHIHSHNFGDYMYTAKQSCCLDDSSLRIDGQQRHTPSMGGCR